MKNYEDMARDVLQRINEYEAEKEMKRAKMTKVVASVTPVFAAAVVGVGLWKLNATDKSNNHVIGKIDDSTIIVSDNTHLEIISTNVHNETSSTNKSVQTTKTGISVTTSENTKESTSEKNIASENETDTDNTPTEITAVTTEPIITTKQPTATNVTHTEEQTFVITTESNSESNVRDGNGSGGDAFGSVVIDGITYLQTFSDKTVYTPEDYLGNGGDFKGFYQGDTSISFYTAKENEDIIIVMFYDGGQLNLLKEE